LVATCLQTSLWDYRRREGGGGGAMAAPHLCG